jgi:hypothetical protein
MKFRLYIDESGTHSYSNSTKLDKRYLSLTGIIINSDDYESDIKPALLEIKKLFSDDLDDLPILHREDIQNKIGLFQCLNMPEIEKKFNELLLTLYANGKFVIITVVIDKKDHLERYGDSALHPYHYCLTVLLEKYVSYLKDKGAGDVIAEGRGGMEDMALKEAYKYFYNNGTNFISPGLIQNHLSSKEIKIKPKWKGIDGLQLADLLSLPSKLYVLLAYKVRTSMDNNFNLKIMKVIKTKFYRNPHTNKGIGYGIKLL